MQLLNFFLSGDYGCLYAIVHRHVVVHLTSDAEVMMMMMMVDSEAAQQ